MKKIALVTGGAKRIGSEIVKHLDSKGWRVVIHYNSSEEEAEKLRAEIQNSFIIQQDLSKIEQLDAFLLNIKENFGTPTLLVNNASIFEKDIEEITINNLQNHMNINCFAPILLAQKFAQNGRGNIINIADATASDPAKTYLSYNLSKAALLHATRSLALLLAPHCRVNCISPGYVLEPHNTKRSPASISHSVIASEAQQSIDTSTYRTCSDGFPRRPNELLAMTKRRDAELFQDIPLKNKTEITEIMNAIDFILASRSITGQNIALDS